MKYLLLLLLPASLFSQELFESRREALAAIAKNEFTTSVGWTIKKGDEIQLGSGSMPDKQFAFITDHPNVLSYGVFPGAGISNLPPGYTGRKAIVADFIVRGTRTSGFFILAKLKVGSLSRYVADIENAIEADEIAVPLEYAKKREDIPGAAIISKADELKKLKELLDSGALTQAEFDAEKKKLLDN
jgi:hypothetical protein